MKRSEYEHHAPLFRTRLIAMGALPREQQDWEPIIAEWMTVNVRVVCSTPGCPGAVPKTITVNENADGIHRVHCGDCDTAITDITLVHDPE